MYRSAKYLLQPTVGQARRLDHLLWMQRKLYNDALAERKTAWETERRPVGGFEQAAALTGIATSNPDLGQYGITPARGTLTRLDLAFKAFYRRCQAGEAPGHPRFKSRARWDSVTYNDRACWKVLPETKRLRLMGVGHVKLRMHRVLPGRPKNAIVRREGGRWWVIVQCSEVVPHRLPPTGRQVGVDLGVVRLLTTSDGEVVSNPRLAKVASRRLLTAQQSLSRKTPGSNRRRQQVRRVAAQHRKVRDSRRDLAHQMSRQLVNRFDLIAHEALPIQNMSRRPAPRPAADGTFEHNSAANKAALNRSIRDAGWGQLLRFIAYKAEEAGRVVIAVDPRNTSRTCSSCGHCEAGNRLTQARFVCLSCGSVADADQNAAVNILRAGLALHRQKCEVRDVAEQCSDQGSSLAGPIGNARRQEANL